MKSKILITGIGGDIGQGVALCLKEAGYAKRLIGSDIDEKAKETAGIAHFINSPSASEKGPYAAFLRKIVKLYGVATVIPCSDPEIFYFDANRRQLDTQGLRALIADRHVIQIFSNKFNTYKFLSSQGLPCPKTYLLKNYKDSLRLPVIVKPLTSAGSRGLNLVARKRELDALRILMPQSIVQEYLSDDRGEYTTGIFSDGKKISSITFRRVLGFNGVSRYVTLHTDLKIKRLAEDLAQSCRLVGAINMQTRATKGGYSIFEVNPRISSTVHFRHMFGFKDVLWWLELPERKRYRYAPRYRSGSGFRVLKEYVSRLKNY